MRRKALGFSILPVLGALFFLFHIWKAGRDSAVVLTEAQILQPFLEYHTPSETIRMEELDQARMDPSALLPDLIESNSILYQIEEECKSPEIDHQNQRFMKSVDFELRLCRGEEINANFFLMEPIFHQLGGSFLWHYKTRTSFETPVREAEIPEVTHYFEWRDVQPAIKNTIPPLIARLSLQSLDSLSRKEPFVINSPFVLIAEDGDYLAYDKTVWDLYLKKRSLVLGPWQADCKSLFLDWCVHRSAKNKKAKTILIFGLSFCLTVLSAIALYQIVLRSRERKKIFQYTILIMQTLVRELRTSATNFQLSLASFRNQFDQLSKTNQEEFSRMCDEIQRLNRVINANYSYLKKNDGETGFIFLIETIPSINEFVILSVDSFEGALFIEFLDGDFAVQADPFWLKLCIENLVRNGFNHGSEPVKITIDGSKKIITVEDQGNLDNDDLDELSIPFKRSGKSSGMGLGLSITRKVLNHMDFNLKLKIKRTRFTIEF